MSLRHVLIALALTSACKTKPSPPLLPPEPTPAARSSRAEASGPLNAPSQATPPDEIPGAPSATALPPGFASLQKATRIEIRDEWNGLGPTHDIHARLIRKGTLFVVKAEVGSYSGGPDPTPPRMPCKCDVDATCPCESASVRVENGSVPAAAVEAFLATVARYAVDSEQEWFTGNRWTDDYPRARVVVWIPGEREPIRLSFLDQQRHWRVGDAFLAPDPDAPANAERDGKLHAKLNAAYARMCKAIGFARWTAKRAGSPSGRL